jgi:hypothetical protein
MTTYVHPERVQKGQLLWLETPIEGCLVTLVCRVHSVYRKVCRAEVEILAGGNILVMVDFNRLFEESN